MTQGKNEGTSKARKPYHKPMMTKLTRDEAKVKLLHHANEGDQGAKDALESSFPEALSKDHKN